MKKLMFAAAALAAGVVMAEEITSANIVGYSQNGLKSGATMVAPQFIGVGGANLALEALTPTGDETADNVIIKVLDAAGREVDGMSYMWNDYAYDNPCWVDGGYAQVEGVEFTAGQGLWVYGSKDAQGLQSAGEVGQDDVVVQLRPGAIGAGNPFPVKVALQDLIAEGDEAADNVIIKVLDAAGREVDGMSYMWNDYAYDNPCWVDGGYAQVEGVEFAAGQGLWVYGSKDTQSIRIPAPEL